MTTHRRLLCCFSRWSWTIGGSLSICTLHSMLKSTLNWSDFTSSSFGSWWYCYSWTSWLQSCLKFTARCNPRLSPNSKSEKTEKSFTICSRIMTSQPCRGNWTRLVKWSMSFKINLIESCYLVKTMPPYPVKSRLRKRNMVHCFYRGKTDWSLTDQAIQHRSITKRTLTIWKTSYQIEVRIALKKLLTY